MQAYTCLASIVPAFRFPLPKVIAAGAMTFMQDRKSASQVLDLGYWRAHCLEVQDTGDNV